MVAKALFRWPRNLGWCLTLHALWMASSPLHAVQISFDYRYDANGFFTPERRVLLERAAAEFTSRMTTTAWAQVDPAVTGGHYEMALVNPSTMQVSWITNAVIPSNQITVYVGATDFTKSPFGMMTSSTGDGAAQLLSLRHVSGPITNLLTNPARLRPINAAITFDLQGIKGFSTSITQQWHFDSDGDLNTIDLDPTDPHCYDYTDFYGTAVHELGHVLGIHSPTPFQGYLESDPGFCAAYLALVKSDGHGGYVFTGSHARQLYYGRVGVNIPLDTATQCHFADGVRSFPSGNWPSLTYEDQQPYRIPFSELEFGVFEDLGYTITPVPRPTITSLTGNRDTLNVGVRDLVPYLQFYLATNLDLTTPAGWINSQVVLPTGNVTTVTAPTPLGASQFFLRLQR